MNGYANYETWNAALWIQNDPFLYNTARACVEFCETADTPWAAFQRCMSNCERFTTGDGVRWDDEAINVCQMGALFEEFA